MEIVKYPSPSLFERCAEAKLDAETMAFIREMEAFVRETDCAGMAAPQVGRNIRVFFTKLDDVEAFINPTITTRSSQTYETYEGCLSLEPGKAYPTTRHWTVSVSWTDKGGKKRRGVFKGLMAQVIQHEYDHLEGKMLVDR